MDLYLTDPSRCPDCGSTLPPSRDRCQRCGLVLTGPAAARLWQVSVQAAELLETRRQLIETLRHQAAPAPTPAPAGAPAPAGRPTAPPPAAAVPRPEWSKRRVQNLLLALGVGLLGVAAVIFVAVSWERLGVGGRSAVMAGVTALAGVAAYRANRRGLLSTAEWLSVLTVGLALLDCAGARAADLGGLGSTAPAAYWAGALALVAALSGLLGAVLPTRSLAFSAALLGQLPIPLLSAHLAGDADRPLAVLATGLTVQTVAASAVAVAWRPAAPRLRAARNVVAAGAAVALVLAAFAALGAAYAEDGSLVLGTALLLLLAAVLAAAGTVVADRPVAAVPGALLDGCAAVLVVAAVWAPAYDRVPDAWLPVVLAALGTGLLAATLLVPIDRRVPPAVVALAAGVLPAAAALEPLGRTIEAALRTWDRPWSVPASEVAVVTDRPAAVLLLVAGAALLLGARALRTTLVAVPAVPVLTAAVALAGPALGAGYGGTLALWLLLAAVLLVGGALLDARGRIALGGAALVSATGLLVLAVSWSLAVDVATLLVLPGAALALGAGAAACRGSLALRPWRVAQVLAAGLLLVAEAAAAARHGGAGWPAVWAVALSLLAAAGVAAALGLSRRTTAADPFWAPLHTAAVTVATVAVVGDAAVLARWAGAPAAGCGLAAAVTAAGLLAATALPWRTGRPVRGTVQVAAGLAAVPALGLAALDGSVLWLALLAVGIGVAVVATTPARHRWGWVAGVLLTASSWVRLSLADVVAPEAYTVPAGVALLVLGGLRRRRDPAYGSWNAYGSGLSLVLLPSLARAVTDAGDLRPLLLALAAAGVLAVGAARRLQAPLVLGAAVLAVDALVQLAPTLAAVYDVVPRWVTIGLLGLALVGAGATYEQRVRDLRRVGRHVARLG